MFKTSTRAQQGGLPRKGALRSALAAGALMLGAAGLSAGCLDRPVQPQEPNTSNVFVKTVPTAAIDKIDLLFMIDNSISMSDKQEILKSAVPNLLRRLITPNCVNETTGESVTPTAGACPDTHPKFEFTPINDIHIGAITSALGSHGGTRCNTPNNEATDPPSYSNDMAQLLPSVRLTKTFAGTEAAGFLAWQGGDEAAVTGLVTNFTEHVTAASEYGCGFESSLEAWYRFLVDPNPPVDVQRDPAVNNQNRPTATNPTVIAQRDAFLRSDSLVAIIMLSDENDCSILDLNSGWAVSTDNHKFAPASEECDTNPNAECCYSCTFVGQRPAGCAESPRCATAELPRELDRPNVRCAQQKKRFGFDLLWPVQRYIDGLTKTQIPDYWQDGAPVVANPLFAPRNGKGQRELSLVFLAGIVGVPWQDLATPETVAPGAGLVYQSALEMRANGVWDRILGDQKNGVLPLDPLMIESVAPRTPENYPGVATTHPVTGQAISLAAWSNDVNGNEYDNTKGVYAGDALPPNDDLQYACVFPLATSVPCGAGSDQKTLDKCDCADNLEKGKSLCIEGAGGTPENTQFYAKAYPGTRFLEVLKGIGEANTGIDNAIVASICPKEQIDPSDPTKPSAGYNPAVQSIIERLGEVLGGQCLPRELDIDPKTGAVPCFVIEASVELNDPECVKAGREQLKPEVAEAVRRQLRAEGYCGDAPLAACNTVSMCAIHQFVEEEEKRACFTDNQVAAPGYCYIDPGKGPLAGGTGAGCDATGANCTNQFTADCPASGRRILRFTGTDPATKVPAPGAITLTACVDS